MCLVFILCKTYIIVIVKSSSCSIETVLCIQRVAVLTSHSQVPRNKKFRRKGAQNCSDLQKHTKQQYHIAVFSEPHPI